MRVRVSGLTKTMSRFIATESVLDEVLWPHWPGFEEAFHPVLPEEPAWVEEITRESSVVSLN